VIAGVLLSPVLAFLAALGVAILLRGTRSSNPSPSLQHTVRLKKVGQPLDDHLVEVPSRARAWAARRSLRAISGPNFSTQAAPFHRRRQAHAREQFLYVPVTQGEAEIKPDRVLNDMGRKGDDGDTTAEPWLMISCPSPSLDPHSWHKALGEHDRVNAAHLRWRDRRPGLFRLTRR
jgi:hypothetical protein